MRSLYINKGAVDLMQLLDPDDLNGDGKKTYEFAYSHIQNLLIINKNAWINNNTKPTGIDFGDHTFFGWATVFMYFLVSIKTGYKASVANIKKDNSYFWLGLTILLIFLGFNKQLDLQTNLTEWLRAISKMHGWYEQRRGVQFLFVSLMGLTIPLILISLRVFLFNSWRRYKLTWICIVVLLVFATVRAASFHHVDLFFTRQLVVCVIIKHWRYWRLV